VPLTAQDVADVAKTQIIRRSSSLGLEQNAFVASDLQAFSIQQTGRLDYTAVIKQSDGQVVWSCEHITHHEVSSAIECANRELARRTPPEKHSQK
jgi:N-methylhydantoinase B/oxoprolinase/acetone carboxylase alpha subunit